MDDRGGNLSQGAVRQADQRRVRHRRMGVEAVFDLDTINILAAPDDDVLGAIDNVAKSFRIHARQITRAHPSVEEGGSGRFGVAPIALHHLGPERP